MGGVMRRQWLLAGFSAAAGLAAGCVVGDGTGTADGTLWMNGCLEGGMYGPQEYHLSPTYFVGEPIEDISDGPPANRLIIRMQRNGDALEITDTLYFDIPNSREVARCLRGRIDPNTGMPDWDTTSGTLNDMDPPWCGPPATADGPPRIRLFAFGPVRSSFTPLGTCKSASHPPNIVSITGVAKDGWVDFVDFGHAEQNDKAPEMRDAVENDFKVNFGERLQAEFQMTLDDDRVLTAIRMMIDVPPAPNIGGDLTGRFDFDLQRGQGAQTFP
jgi:hypothetical protein